MVKIDPNHKYYLNNAAWPYALPLVNDNGSTCGTAMYSHRDDTFIYYVIEKKYLKLRINNSEK